MKNTEELLKSIEANSSASAPGGIPLCRDHLRHLRPDFFGLQGYFLRVGARYMDEPIERDRIERNLRGGDSRAAVVISTSPLLIAAYTDELDCVAMLRFKDSLNLVDQFGLTVGSQLLSVNYYSRSPAADQDLFPGPLDTGSWTGFEPIIADFLTTDLDQLANRKQTIPVGEWERAEEMGKEYVEKWPGLARDGRPGQSFCAASV